MSSNPDVFISIYCHHEILMRSYMYASGGDGGLRRSRIGTLGTIVWRIIITSENEQRALLLYICICHRNGRDGALKKVFLFFVATPWSAAPATLFSLCVLYDFDYILLLFLVYLFRFCQIAYRDESKGRFLGFAQRKKATKKNFFNEQISLIFPLIGCHLLSGERNGKRQQQQNVPANEKFPLGICMQKSAAMAATTAATPSSFITGARELLHFHFWFGSLRCSFVIKENWGKEKERDGEAIEHRPVHIRTLSPRYTQADGLYVQF